MYGSHISPDVASYAYSSTLRLEEILFLLLIPLMAKHVRVAGGSEYNTGPSPFTTPASQKMSSYRHEWSNGTYLRSLSLSLSLSLSACMMCLCVVTTHVILV